MAILLPKELKDIKIIRLCRWSTTADTAGTNVSLSYSATRSTENNWPLHCCPFYPSTSNNFAKVTVNVHSPLLNRTGHWQWNLPLVECLGLIYGVFCVWSAELWPWGFVYCHTDQQPHHHLWYASFTDFSLTVFFSSLLISDSTKTPTNAPFAGNPSTPILLRILIFNWLI